MNPNQNNDYEFSERAAIREVEAGLPKGTADFFAQQEVQVRNVQDNIRQRRPEAKQHQQQEHKQQARPQSCRSGIKQLQKKRDDVGSRLRAEKDPARKDELFAAWMQLNEQIIEMGKEAKR